MTGQADSAGSQPRVGILLVSHSRQVAESVAHLAVGLAGRDTSPIAGAGGAPDGGLGTSADSIAEAARKVDGGAGVAILMDLGSAVLTVKALLAEGDELPEQSRMVDAPLVEGAVSALVTASGGADLETVAAAAAEAYDYRKL